jgi:hypothetical protein
MCEKVQQLERAAVEEAMQYGGEVDGEGGRGH